MKTQLASGRATVAITRSRKGNEELARRLRTRGFKPISIETIEFLPPEDWSETDARLKDLRTFDWLLFASRKGVEYFAQRMKSLSIAPNWSGKPLVAAVGEKTGDSLRKEGIRVDFVPSKFATSSLANELPNTHGSKLLVLRSDIGDLALLPALKRRGFQASEVVVYRTLQVGGTKSSPAGADVIVFASPSAVEAFMRRFGAAGQTSMLNAIALCIGPVTTAAARGAGFKRIVMPEVHTIDGILETLEGLRVA